MNLSEDRFNKTRCLTTGRDGKVANRTIYSYESKVGLYDVVADDNEPIRFRVDYGLLSDGAVGIHRAILEYFWLVQA